MGATANWLARLHSIEELEVMMRAALAEHTGGKSVIEWAVGDSSAKKQQWLTLPPAMRVAEIGLALSIKDPDTYPPAECTPITRTRVAFAAPVDTGEED